MRGGRELREGEIQEEKESRRERIKEKAKELVLQRLGICFSPLTRSSGWKRGTLGLGRVIYLLVTDFFFLHSVLEGKVQNQRTWILSLSCCRLGQRQKSVDLKQVS